MNKEINQVRSNFGAGPAGLNVHHLNQCLISVLNLSFLSLCENSYRGAFQINNWK